MIPVNGSSIRIRAIIANILIGHDQTIRSNELHHIGQIGIKTLEPIQLPSPSVVVDTDLSVGSAVTVVVGPQVHRHIGHTRLTSGLLTITVLVEEHSITQRRNAPHQSVVDQTSIHGRVVLTRFQRRYGHP